MHLGMKETLLAHSESACWEKAKVEWDFENAFYTEERVPCICTDFPIQNVCVIYNIHNGNRGYVCSSCAKRVLGIDIADKIFGSLAKLKKDLSKSMSRDVLEFLYSRLDLSMTEIGFYLSVMRKHKLSERQMNFKRIINKKLINYLNYETYLTFLRIWNILLWAEVNTWYDSSFVESVNRDGERKGLFSSKQIEKIDEIHYLTVLNDDN